jgi:hypothetical protein
MMLETYLPEAAWPARLPALHREHLRAVIRHVASNPDCCGLAAGGSFITGAMDDYSDLDLVVVVPPSTWPAVLARRVSLVAAVAPVLTAFTGEHVHEPRLLIVLHGPPLLHVDYKFVSLDHVATRVEDPVILWERAGQLSRAFATEPAVYPLPDPQWLEDRFWTWIHYITTKLARRELFEVLDVLAYFRKRVFGPLLLAPSGAQPSGVRRIEAARPDAVAALAQATARHSLPEAVAAVRASITLYRSLRPPASSTFQWHREAEAAVVAYFDEQARAL